MHFMNAGEPLSGPMYKVKLFWFMFPSLAKNLKLNIMSTYSDLRIDNVLDYLFKALEQFVF